MICKVFLKKQLLTKTATEKYGSKNIISKNLVLVWKSSLVIFVLIKDVYELQSSEGVWMQAFGFCLISNKY